jgi:hypothetical protein
MRSLTGELPAHYQRLRPVAIDQFCLWKIGGYRAEIF